MSDEQAWLIARETPGLRRYARALVKDPVRADDLVQDSLERALRKRRQLRKQGSLRSWLFRILYTVYLNGRSSRYAAPTGVHIEDEAEPIAGPARQVDQLECAMILEALDRLPPGQRDAILLIALEGLGYDEAASVLGIEVGTLKSRLSRGREALRRMQQEHGNAEPERRLRRVK